MATFWIGAAILAGVLALLYAIGEIGRRITDQEGDQE
ncbi:hypothetical protein EVC26_029 [Rhizobium phage RHph_I72]|nr:hypothetical protein EVC26_029 [Rhizobium phage RHph_I72]